MSQMEDIVQFYYAWYADTNWEFLGPMRERAMVFISEWFGRSLFGHEVIAFIRSFKTRLEVQKEKARTDLEIENKASNVDHAEKTALSNLQLNPSFKALCKNF